MARTLDEAIAHEKEVAEKNRSEYEFECSYYGKETVDNGEKLDCVKCAEEHEQLAEWLEELKSYREVGVPLLQHLHDEDIYNKAIDDFVDALADDLTWLMRFGDEVYIDVGNDVRIRAEQLKAGGEEWQIVYEQK